MTGRVSLDSRLGHRYARDVAAGVQRATSDGAVPPQLNTEQLQRALKAIYCTASTSLEVVIERVARLRVREIKLFSSGQRHGWDASRGRGGEKCAIARQLR